LACTDYLKAVENEFSEAGLSGEKIRVSFVGNGMVYSAAAEKAGVARGTIGISGFHVGVILDDLVYDNLRSGIPVQEWIDDLMGATAKMGPDRVRLGEEFHY